MKYSPYAAEKMGKLLKPKKEPWQPWLDSSDSTAHTSVERSYKAKGSIQGRVDIGTALLLGGYIWRPPPLMGSPFQ